MYLSSWEIVLRLLVATALGVIFGIERKRRKKPVGSRTHVLVCLAACVIAMISAYGFGDVYLTYPQDININTDPARLVVGVLTGIGFIGAGIIWRSESGTIQGITTAAEIFLLAALGIGCGLGLYFLVAAATVIAILDMTASSIYNYIRNNIKAKKTTYIEQRADMSPDEQNSSTSS